MQKQQGMTLIGMLFIVVVVVMTAIVVMRALPVYLQHYAIVQSIKGLNSTPITALTGDYLVDAVELRKSLDKRLDINGLDSLKENELTITPNGENRFQVKLNYQAIRFLVYNVSLLFVFDGTYQVVIGSEN